MTARLRVFLDSNVLISALIGDSDSAPVILVDWLAGGQPVWQAFLARSGIQVLPGARGRTRGINARDAAIVAAAFGAGSTGHDP